MKVPKPRQHPLCYFAAMGIAIIIFLGIRARVYRPAADPPHWLYVFNTDEGHYSYNTNNKVKYGTWFVNDAQYALITPFFSFAQYVVAAALPNQTGIIRFRAISILSGILYCFAVGILFRTGGILRWSAVALASVSFMGIVHSRLGIPEMMLTLWLLITVLLVIEGERRQSRMLYFLAGLAVVACVTIKPTGIVMLLVVVTAPLLCRRMGRKSQIEFLFVTTTGVVLGAIVFVLVIIIPNLESWSKMVAEATSMGRGSLEPSVLESLGALFNFLLSPAMQTMPMLWPMALFWSFFLFLPRLKNGENKFDETLLFLWLFFGIALLGLSSYQPARWQLLLFPPVIGVGFRFLTEAQKPRLIAMAMAVALLISALSTLRAGGEFFILSGTLEPGDGIFNHIISLTIAGSAFFVGILLTRLIGTDWRSQIICGIVFAELSVQLLLNIVYMKPTYSRENQWEGCSRELEKLDPDGKALFTGTLVQDLSLRANIHVLPTYYVLRENEMSDDSVSQFFSRQKKFPNYFLLLDSDHVMWAQKAPNFVKGLEALGRCRLIIGGLGLHDLYIYRIH